MKKLPTNAEDHAASCTLKFELEYWSKENILRKLDVFRHVCRMINDRLTKQIVFESTDGARVRV